MADGSEAPTGAVAASARATLAPKDALGWVDKRSYPRKLRGMLALDDFERVARRRLPRPIYGYVAGGVETDASLRGNRAVFDEIAFVPKMLVDTSARSLETTLFGHTYDAPFGLAPMGGSSLAACQGDIVLARAACPGQHSDDHQRRIAHGAGACARGRRHHVVPGVPAG